MSRVSPTKRECGRFIKAIAQSRQHVERLLADVPDEHYVLSLLGPTLVNRTTSER
jgi:hypothetical protein